MNSPLQASILNAIIFFDLADFPLTFFEIYKWLWQPDRHYTLAEVESTLRDTVAAGVLISIDGFYCLPGRESTVMTRLVRYQIAERKFKVALRMARLLRLVPFVRLIAVCNTVGYSNARQASDIDFFIIGKGGRLWTVRLLVTFLASVIGYRRHGRRVTDRVCLSFYVADNALNLSTIALEPIDPYLVYWHRTMTPLYASADSYQRFCRANHWVDAVLPQASPVQTSARRTVIDHKTITLVRSAGEWVLSGALGAWCERVASWLQMIKIQYRPAPAVRGERSVIVSDTMLKFHEVDRRAMFRSNWETKRHEFGIV